MYPRPVMCMFICRLLDVSKGESCFFYLSYSPFIFGNFVIFTPPPKKTTKKQKKHQQQTKKSTTKNKYITIHVRTWLIFNILADIQEISSTVKHEIL